MYQRLTRTTLACFGVLAALAVAGCPNSPLGELGDNTTGQNDNIAGGSNSGGSSGGSSSESTQQATFAALESGAQSDSIDSEEYSESDEQPYFGEAALLYGVVSESARSAAIEFSDNPNTGVSDEDGSADSDGDGTTSSDGGSTDPGSSDGSDGLGGEEPPVATFAKHGTYSGTFGSDEDDKGRGVFRGTFFDPNGAVVAVMRGFSVAIAGDSARRDFVKAGVFRGKVIAPNGRFLGFVHGRFGALEGGPSLMYGIIRDRFHRFFGVMKGQWVSEAEGKGGSFSGQWAQLDVCFEVNSLPDYPFEEGDFGGLNGSDASGDGTHDSGAIQSHRSIETETRERMELDDTEFRDDTLARRDGKLPVCVDPEKPHGFIGGWYVGGLRSGRKESECEVPDASSLFFGLWRSGYHRVHGFLQGYTTVVSSEAHGGGGGAGKDPAENASKRMTGPNVGVVPTRAAAPKSPKGAGPMRSGQDEGEVHGVFYGRIFDPQRNVIGYMRGAYGRSVHGVPVFRGQYFGADGAPKGALGGRWGNHPRKPGGPFFGLWSGEDLFPNEPQGVPGDSDGDGSADENTHDEEDWGSSDDDQE